MNDKPGHAVAAPAAKVAAVVFLALAAYAWGLNHSALMHHVPTDVTDAVLDNPILRSWSTLPKVFGGEFMLSTYGRYEPLGYALFGAVNATARDAPPVFWRAALLGLHAATGALVFLALWMLLEDAACAFALAAGYVLCPALVPVVCDVNLINVALGLLFAASSLLMLAVHVRKSCPWALAFSALLFAAGVFSCARIASALGAVAAVSLLGRTRPRAAAIAVACVALAAPAAAVAGVPNPAATAILVVAAILGGGLAGPENPEWKALAWRLAPYLAATAAYAALAASIRPLPLHTQFLEEYVSAELRPGDAVQPIFALRTAVTGSWLLSAGCLGAAAMAVAAFLRGRARLVVAGASALLLAASTISGTGRYRDDVSYWESAARSRPASFSVRLNLAEARIASRQFQAAREELLDLYYGAELPPLAEATVRTKLGRAYAGEGNVKLAGFHIFNFGTVANWYRDTMKNRLRVAGDFAFSCGYVSVAEYYWACALVLDQSDARLYRGLGQSLIYKDFFRAAERHFLKALELEPGDERALYYMAFCAQSLGRKKDFERYSSLWKEASGSRSGMDFAPIFDRLEGFDKDRMLGLFSGEPLLLAMYPAWNKADGSYVLARGGRIYRFAEVPYEAGCRFMRKGRVREAYDQLKLAHEADPSSKEITRKLVEVCVRLGALEEARGLDLRPPGEGR